MYVHKYTGSSHKGLVNIKKDLELSVQYSKIGC